MHLAFHRRNLAKVSVGSVLCVLNFCDTCQWSAIILNNFKAKISDNIWQYFKLMKIMVRFRTLLYAVVYQNLRAIFWMCCEMFQALLVVFPASYLKNATENISRYIFHI